METQEQTSSLLLQVRKKKEGGMKRVGHDWATEQLEWRHSNVSHLV